MTESHSNHHILEPCEGGTYRDIAMTTCDECDPGEEPNTEKTACGKIYFLCMLVTFLILPTLSNFV